MKAKKVKRLINELMDARHVNLLVERQNMVRQLNDGIEDVNDNIAEFEKVLAGFEKTIDEIEDKVDKHLPKAEIKDGEAAIIARVVFPHTNKETMYRGGQGTIIVPVDSEIPARVELHVSVGQKGLSDLLAQLGIVGNFDNLGKRIAKGNG